jgi:hypothetical protein
MKKVLLGLAFTAVASVAYAQCTTSTVNYGGKFVTCTTCCDSRGNCNTTCF